MVCTLNTTGKPWMLLLFGLFFLSGATGLVYELIWTRELIFVFGGTTYAITTVLVAFMGGLGIGSYLAGRVAGRIKQPGRVYGLLELIIGAYALCVPLLLGLSEPLYRALYPHVAQTPWMLNGARFVVGTLTLFLPTLCMGATLPILVRFVTAKGAGVGWSVGLLYGVNTLGAVFGVLATGFVLIPVLGLTHTTWVAAGANVVVGVLALVILRVNDGEGDIQDDNYYEIATPKPATTIEITPEAMDAVLVTFAVSGFAAMVYQITWTRSLIMAIGSSTYSFTCILAAFILGLAVGSLVLGKRADRWRNPVLALAWIQFAVALASLLVVPLLGKVPLAVGWLVVRLGGRFELLTALEFLLIIALTFVPTFFMGAVFPLVTRVVAARLGDAGRATGRAYLTNTVGTIVGAFLAGFVLIRSDVLGVQRSIWLAAALNTAAGMWLVMVGIKAVGANRRRVLMGAWGAVALVPLVALGAGSWDRRLATAAPFLGHLDQLRTADRREMLYYEEGVDLNVAVERSRADPDMLSLSVNGKTDASTTLTDMPNMLLLGHLGALVGNGGPDGCVIGLGGGMSLAALARHPWYERIDCVEISAEVIRAARFFGPYVYDVLSDPRLEMIPADGRNHMLLTDRRYDVIVSQPSNPWIAGVSNLFTREYFDLCHDRLKPGGVFVAWVQAYSLGLEEFRMIVRTLCGSFEKVTVWDTSGGDYLFVAGSASMAVSLETLRNRMMEPTVRADLHRLGINHIGQVLGAFIASDAALRAWSASAVLHTDDNAILEFTTPRQMLRDDSFEISQALSALQQSPFDDMVRVDRASDWQSDVIQRVSRAAVARDYRDLAYRKRRENDIVGALEAFARGYREDPGNIGVSHGFHFMMAQMRHRDIPAELMPRLLPVLAELNGYRGPMLAPMKGGTLDEIVQFNTNLGTQAFAEGYWIMASEYFEAATAIQPDNLDLQQVLAVSYSRCGRLEEAIALMDWVVDRRPDDPEANFTRGQFAVFADDFDEALRRFEVVLRAGSISPDDLAANESLAKIRAHPDFVALLERYRSKPD